MHRSFIDWPPASCFSFLKCLTRHCQHSSVKTNVLEQFLCVSSVYCCTSKMKVFHISHIRNTKIHSFLMPKGNFNAGCSRSASPLQGDNYPIQKQTIGSHVQIDKVFGFVSTSVASTLRVKLIRGVPIISFVEWIFQSVFRL